MRLYLAIIILLLSHNAIAQTESNANDKFRGTWIYGTEGTPNEVYMKLEVANMHDYVLYPSKLTISINSFTAEYHLLLVKKNFRQIAIGHPKKVISETPFSVGNVILQMNGVFDLQTDRNGKSFLTINRQRFKKVKLKTAKETGDENTANLLFGFLTETNFRLFQTSDTAWEDPSVLEILNSPYSGYYYGKKDTFNVKSLRGVSKFSGKNSGIVSVSVNGRTLFDMGYANDKTMVNEIKLEPGINMIAMFVEQYGKKPNLTANLELDFFATKTALNFTAPEDFTSTCIVIPVVYYGDSDTGTTKLNNLRLMKEQLLARNETIYYYPQENNQQLIVKPEVQSTLLRQSTIVGNLTSKSREVLLGLWDDAVEDGDSISLNINGTWVVQGMPVLKRPQFISVKLNAGVNKIIFIADNQGSIIPNTSMLEIIDDHQRKSFKINTDFSQNNLINILYELPPGSNP